MSDLVFKERKYDQNDGDRVDHDKDRQGNGDQLIKPYIGDDKTEDTYVTCNFFRGRPL